MTDALLEGAPSSGPLVVRCCPSQHDDLIHHYPGTHMVVRGMDEVVFIGSKDECLRLVGHDPDDRKTQLKKLREANSKLREVAEPNDV